MTVACRGLGKRDSAPEGHIHLITDFAKKLYEC